MKIDRRLLIIGMFLMVSYMVIATQYAVIRVGYEYTIIHPCDSNIRFIGSDNSSDSIRILRVDGDNSTMMRLKLVFGNYSVNQIWYYTAAFGIVNEENHTLNITHINVSSSNWTYMKIWLHGDRDANANNISNDPSSVLMYNNGTIVNASNTTAWALAPGDKDASDMCSNVSDRANYSIDTTWDDTAHVRYSVNNTNVISGISDFVWVQIAIDITDIADYIGLHTGTILTNFEADSLS